MDIVVKGRQSTVVPDHFRQHVSEKLSRIERYDHKVIRLDVEISHERNPRQSSKAQRVEITCVSKGPVVRAEACAADFYAAVDMALGKLEARLRRSADRRRVHHGLRTPPSIGAIPTVDEFERPISEVLTPNGARPADDRVEFGQDPTDQGEDSDETAASPFVVREKVHRAEPMTMDQALHEMELIGHDFFLFSDATSGLPSVVYRRRGYDYGVLRLQT